MGALTIDASEDIAVIGAGIVGLSIALRLLQAGHRVLVVDAAEPMSGCSAGNAGYLSESNIFPPVTPDMLRKLPGLLFGSDGPLAISPAYLPHMAHWAWRASAAMRDCAGVSRALSRLVRPSQECLRALARVAGADHLLHQDGGLVVYKDSQAWEAKKSALSVWAEHGIAAESISGEAIRNLEPALASGIVGGIHFKNAGRCSNPKRLGQLYFEHLQRHGSRFIGHAVHGLTSLPDGRVELVMADRNVRVKQVVVAAGYASESILNGFGYKKALAAERGYHLMLAEPSVRLTRPVVFGEPHFAATPMDEGLRLAGTAEFSSPNSPPNMQRALELLDLAKLYISDLEFSSSSAWMGVRPSFPDGIPAIGRVKSKSRIFYAFGHGHNGLTHSAITAECISALVREDLPQVDIAPFDLSRFG